MLKNKTILKLLALFMKNLYRLNGLFKSLNPKIRESISNTGKDIINLNDLNIKSSDKFLFSLVLIKLKK